GADAFHENYVKRFNDPPDYHAAEAYAAVLVAADALKRAGSHSSQAIRKALNQTVLTTPFGPVKFYNYHRYERQNSIRTLVLQIIIGRFTLIWPPEFAESGFIPPAILQAPE
ncbi:MAG: ABC transporter substrate-binding protein, partial [Desulfobacterales bacterium]